MSRPGAHLIEWQQEWAVGLDRMDTAHRSIMDSANKLLLAMRDGKAGDKDRAVASLADNTRKHFEDEEKWMQETAYAGFGEHLADHDRSLQNLVRFAGECSWGRHPAAEARTFLSAWLLGHILEADMYFAAHLTKYSLA